MALSLPVLYVRGNNYEVGKATGQSFRQAIRDSLENMKTLSDILLPFYITEKGRRIVDTYLQTARDHYPQYVSELQGIADGAKIDFIKLFLVHVEVELIQNSDAPGPVSSEGCSDILLNTGDTALLAHTEDAVPEICDHGYILRAHVLPSVENAFTEERFTAYAYPGGLPGNAVGFNQHGLVVSGNVVYQRKSNLQGIPRRIIFRAVLAAKNRQDVQRIVCLPPGMATGFHFNLAEVPDPLIGLDTPMSCNMASLEVKGLNGASQASFEEITGLYHHFNNYLRMEGEFYPDPSSEVRERRLAELKQSMPLETAADLIQVLGDTEETQFPFYRNGRKPDVFANACTAVFDMRRRIVDFYKGNPKVTDPIVSFPLDNWK